jgi:hypothetical protein
MKYETTFENNYIKTKTEIVYDNNDPEYFLPMTVNGIIIETDGFEALTINSSENYSKDQLKIFDYDLVKGFYKLKNYYLKTIIPISIIEKNNGRDFLENMIVEIIDKENNTIRKIKIFDNEIVVKRSDLLEAFDELYETIKEKYIFKICVFCKKSSWNPYSGNDFYNHLCFREFAKNYYKIDRNNKIEIVKLMEENNRKYKSTYLTYFCNEYENK